ncbi:MAG: patatin-like phospholipase family protein [Hyphomicrobiaceae bacterium]
MTKANPSTAPKRSAQSGKRPSIALALGGGGARGLAHIPMLEVFDELNIRPKVIGATSIGAIFGAAYASGLKASEIRVHTEQLFSRRSEIARQVLGARAEPLQRVFSVFQMRSSLLSAEKLLENILPTGTAQTFADLKIPMRILATDYYTQEEVVLRTGNLRQAVAASMALPALFKPISFWDHLLIDGGLVNPLPFDVVAPEADLVVAIDVSGAGHAAIKRKTPTAFEALVASSQIFQNSIVREKLRSRQPDILINMDVGEFYLLDFFKTEKILEAAEPAKDVLRNQLKRILAAETLEEQPEPIGCPASGPASTK